MNKYLYTIIVSFKTPEDIVSVSGDIMASDSNEAYNLFVDKFGICYKTIETTYIHKGIEVC